MLLKCWRVLYVLITAKNITVRNLFCHGSHGLTLSGTNATIEDVVFENSVITMAENGIHVKTHILDGDGLIKNVVYRNITILGTIFCNQD